MRRDIKTNFGAVAKEYDNQRKWLIPCFDEFYACIVDCVADSETHTNILDIGAGTGLLTAFLLTEYPDSHFTLIDLSDEMIQQAKQRFQDKPNVTYIIDDYSTCQFIEKYDVIVSSLSIHHLENTEKQQLYKTIFQILKKGGIFVNGDQFLSRNPVVEDQIKRKWKLKIETGNLSQQEINAAYERMKLDKPATIEENIKWIEDAGFTNVDLLYKYYPFGVICGSRNI